jgi:hypothetical protein
MSVSDLKKAFWVDLIYQGNHVHCRAISIGNQHLKNAWLV